MLECLRALPDSCLQPFAGLLPHTVMQPGRVVGAVTRQAAEQYSLRKDCLVCAGTSGKGSCGGRTCLLASTISTASLRQPVHIIVALEDIHCLGAAAGSLRQALTAACPAKQV